MKIGLDLDSTINEIMPAWLKNYNFAFEDNLTPEDITSWDIASIVKPECGRNIFEFLSETVIRRAPIQPNAYNVIKRLYEKHDCYIVTASFSNHVSAKYEWIREYLPFFKRNRVIFCHNKSLLALDILVDDGLHNFPSGTIYHPIVFSQPWNKESDLPRANNWLEVEEKINNLAWLDNYKVSRVHKWMS